MPARFADERVLGQHRQQRAEIRGAADTAAEVVDDARRRPSPMAEMTPAWTKTANTCLNAASPPIAALKIANRMPAMITAMSGDHDRACRSPWCRAPYRRALLHLPYIWSSDFASRTASDGPVIDGRPAPACPGWSSAARRRSATSDRRQGQHAEPLRIGGDARERGSWGGDDADEAREETHRRRRDPAAAAVFSHQKVVLRNGGSLPA